MAADRQVGGDGSIRSVIIALRLTPAEKHELLELCKGQGISQYVREKVFGR